MRTYRSLGAVGRKSQGHPAGFPFCFLKPLSQAKKSAWARSSYEFRWHCRLFGGITVTWQVVQTPQDLAEL
jgi:hypothetical protein